MTSAESVRDRALEIARLESDAGSALRALVRYCAGETLAASMARDELSIWLEDVPGHRVARRALDLLDELLGSPVTASTPRSIPVPQGAP